LVATFCNLMCLFSFSSFLPQPSLLLNTHLFSFEKATSAPGWLQELRGTHVPETLEYGISSFVFRAKRPFHPTKLYSLVYKSDKLSSVLRSKGFFWLGCDGGMDEVGIWAHAGKLYSFQAGRDWWCSMTSDKWPEIVKRQLGDEAVKRCEKEPLPVPTPPFPYRHDEVTETAVWDPFYGDRRQEIVIIGCGMDKAKVEAALRECLLTDEEFSAGPEGYHAAGCPNARLAEERKAKKAAAAAADDDEDEDDEDEDDDGSVYPGDDGCLKACVQGWDGYDDPFDFFEYAAPEGKDEDGEEEEEGHGHGHSHGHSHGKAGAGGGHVHGPGCKH
jgi:Cobalamin synthesis protein cobW C-terminal domain